MERVTFYIDGFNFYFGLRQSRKSDSAWGRFYWIDMVKLCESFLAEGQELSKVIYFTASPLSKERNSRQSAFLNANKLVNGSRFEVVRGKYMEKQITCPYCNSNITRPEEKKTDVNISTRMIADCVQNQTDKIVLISADSDLIPPLEFIQRQYPKVSIKVYFPPSRYSSDLKDNMLHHRSKPVLLEKNMRRFEAAVMPDEVSNGEIKYTIPQKWKDWA